MMNKNLIKWIKWYYHHQSYISNTGKNTFISGVCNGTVQLPIIDSIKNIEFFKDSFTNDNILPHSIINRKDIFPDDKSMSYAIAQHLTYQYSIENIMKSNILFVYNAEKINKKCFKSAQIKIEIIQIFDKYDPLETDIVRLSCKFSSNIFSERNADVIYNKSCRVLSEILSTHSSLVPINYAITAIYHATVSAMRSFEDIIDYDLISDTAIEHAVKTISEYTKLSNAKTIYKNHKGHKTLYIIPGDSE